MTDCKKCGRISAAGLKEWDDSPELICFGEKDPLCKPSEKFVVKCEHCAKPATCIGRYEGAEVETAACDDCCAHGNEDGVCHPIADICTGCGARPCNHLWAQQKKCCPDCSHK